MDLEFNNNTPIYLQIVDKLKILIIKGEMKSGSRIPSVRELALTLKVNPNTIQRALMELENENLIYTERTNGKFVTENQDLINKKKEEYAINLSKEYFYNMKEIGFSKNEAINLIKDMKGME